MIDYRGAKNNVIQEILKLEPGENLFVAKEDWTIKTSLSMQLGQYRARLNKKITTRSAKDGSGWVVTMG